MPNENLPTDPGPTQEPSVTELLLAEVDAACRLVGLELDRLERVTSQLHPERARSCGSAVAMMRVMVTEVGDRAHARPID